MSEPVLRMDWTVENQSTTVLFDASIQERFEGGAEVPSHPVEQGQNITDNIRPLPDKLNISAMISNTPIGVTVYLPSTAASGSVKRLDLKTGQRLIGAPSAPPPPANTLQFSSTVERVIDATSALVAAKNLGALVTVTTSLRTYENYAITHVGIPRNAQNGTNAVIVAIELEQIKTATVKTSTASEAQATKKRGSVATKEPTEKQENAAKKSLGASLFDSVVGGR